MALDQILKKNFWAVLLALLALVAFLNAQGLMQIVGAGLAPDEKQLAALAGPGRMMAPAPSAVPFHATSAEKILARNPFDSVTGPLNAVPIELPMPDTAGGAQGPDMSDPMNAPPCEGVKVLVIAASADPEWSFAAFQAGNDPKSVLRRRGGEVGTKTVKFVGWDRVWLATGAQLCQASMFAPPATAAAPPAAAPAVAPAGGPGSLDPAIAKGIQKVSATEFNVDRGVVDKILENQADLMRQARIVPEQENGKMVGIRLFGVKPETLLGVLGMENGDRLQTINGFDMTSPEKALEAYARLRTADHLTVQVNRKGANTNLDYNIK
jgi:general secretion pathway protein C